MKVISSGVVAGFAAVALVSLAPAAQADAGQTVQIRQGDFISQLSDTRANGHVEFLKEGLHVWTDGSSDTGDNGNGGTYNTDKAAEYFSVPSQGIPGSLSLNWYGTDAQPGSQIVFDTDGDTSTQGDSWNVLVGEPVYGDDFWLTPSSDVYKNHKELCPETGGGFGSDCHGTLAQWQQVLPNVKVEALGFSLGSGIKGDGVIHDIQADDTDYQFTSEPAVTKVAVTGTATAVRNDGRHASVLRITFKTDALQDNEVQGRRVGFRVVDNRSVVYRTAMGADATAALKLRWTEGTGKHTVRIVQNGHTVQTFVFRMG